MEHGLAARYQGDRNVSFAISLLRKICLPQENGFLQKNVHMLMMVGLDRTTQNSGERTSAEITSVG